MELNVKSIHITAKDGEVHDFDPSTGNTDVIVFLENGKKFIASFFAYGNIEVLRLVHQFDGAFLNGNYFWDKNMILVKECTLKSIELVVTDIIEEGNFQEAFRQL
jgi:hypothetical protein